MAKKLTPLPPDQIDTTRTDKQYWEDVLRREGLSMTRGLHPNVYVGTAREAEEVAEGADVKIDGHYGIVMPSKSSSQ